MESYHRFTAVVILMAAVIFIGANISIRMALQSVHGRMYRVEAARLAKEIQRNGYEDIDLSGCDYIYHIERYPAAAFTEPESLQQFLQGEESDYCMRFIDGAFYRFDYTWRLDSERANLTGFMNLALIVMSLLLLSALMYVRQKIIKPFEAMKELPYELSKGRLTTPLPENKNRFFGEFIWGIDLLRENIQQQKKRELGLQRAQKTLVLSVSHDIKTPLSAIKLYAKVISRHLYADDEQLLGIAESIDTKADEIGGFVTQMVKASGEDFLNIEVRKDGFYLSQLIKKTTAYYEDKLKLLRTQFQVGAYKDCMLKGDFDRSVEVVQNMMENAVKYGDGRSISLVFAEEDGCVLVTVKNSGNTLPETELLYIFDSFWRGSNTKSCSGSGLGLYICRSLMQRMDGDIFAQVQEGDMCVTAVFRK